MPNTKKVERDRVYRKKWYDKNKDYFKKYKSDHPEAMAYYAMKSRCYNPNSSGYENYGGRGIKVCERWLGKDGLKKFLVDMGKRPDKEYSLDRIDVNGNYEPDNCRWATIIEQHNNTRNNIKYNGKSLTEIAREKGVSYVMLKDRIAAGWEWEKALTMPSQRKKIKGISKGVTQWKNHGIKYGYWNYFRKEILEEVDKNIGMLRQWLNEDRITEPDKMVTNEEIKRFIK